MRIRIGLVNHVNEWLVGGSAVGHA
jgi:hypothetical protein